MTEPVRRAARRLLLALALALVFGAAADVTLTRLRYEPTHELVLGTALALGALVGLLLAAQVEGPTWEISYQRPTLSTGHDQRVAAFVRVVEDNRLAAHPGPELQQRLRRLAEDTRRTRQGGDGAPWPPGLAAVLEGPPRRLSARELDAVLAGLEAL